MTLATRSLDQSTPETSSYGLIYTTETHGKAWKCMEMPRLLQLLARLLGIHQALTTAVVRQAS